MNFTMGSQNPFWVPIESEEDETSSLPIAPLSTTSFKSINND